MASNNLGAVDRAEDRTLGGATMTRYWVEVFESGAHGALGFELWLSKRPNSARCSGNKRPAGLKLPGISATKCPCPIGILAFIAL